MVVSEQRGARTHDDMLFRGIRCGLDDPNPGEARLRPPPKVMATPPTMSESSASTIAGAVKTPIESPHFRHIGAELSVAGAGSPDNVMLRTTSLSTAPGVMSYTVDFETDAVAFELVFKSVTGGRYRMWVDDELVTAAVQTPATADGSVGHIKAAFAAAARRRVRIEMVTLYFGGIKVGPTETVWRSSAALGRRVIVLGDSYTEGSGGAGWLDSYVHRCARLMGWRDVWASGAGGTGYLNDGGTKLTFRERLSADVTAFDPDVVIVAGGYNDTLLSASAVGSEAALLYSQIRAEAPDAVLIVVGPWSPSAAPPAALTAIRDAIKAAAAAYTDLFVDPIAGQIVTPDGPGTAYGSWITGTGRVGATTGTGNADRYTSSDAVHPTAAGSEYLGYRLASAIAEALPL